jgi:hypothetical protein
MIDGMTRVLDAGRLGRWADALAGCLRLGRAMACLRDRRVVVRPRHFDRDASLMPGWSDTCFVRYD